MLPEPTTQAAITPVAGPSSARPIAGTRHRRTDSLRSLRSQTSDGSSASALATPSFPPPLASPASFGPQRPPPPGAGLLAPQIPTAYLDLDFVLIRANVPFTQIISGGREMTGRQLGEFAAPVDSENFNAIKNQLRAEREAREPAYMAPILHAGQDPLQGVSESDIDRLSQSFTDHTYTWTRSQPMTSTETFPARIRLAKAAIYFVVVTLPSFRPVVPPQFSVPAPAFAVPPPLPMPEGYLLQRQGATQSAPPIVYQPPSISAGLPPPERPPIVQATESRTYPPYPLQQPFQPHQQLAPPTTPRLLAAEPPVEAIPFSTPPYIPREALRASEAPVQLPPLVSSSSGSAAQSRARESEAEQQQVLSEEEEDEGGESGRSPKKRRKVGIHDVIQQ